MANIKEAEKKLKPCPFCGGCNIGFSNKTTTINWKRKRHIAMYCKDCNCYGARIIVEENPKYPRNNVPSYLAEQSWNRRA